MSTDSVELDPKAVEALATDPNTVHINLLRGSLARPSIAQIIHIYGADNLRAALSAVPPDTGEAVAWRFRYLLPPDRVWTVTTDKPRDEPGIEYHPLFAHPSKSYEDGVRDAARVASDRNVELLTQGGRNSEAITALNISGRILALLPSTGAGK